MQRFYVSDLHLGHQKIVEMGKGLQPGSCSEERDEILVDRWNSKVPKKRGIVTILGDIAFSVQTLQTLGRLNGRLEVILGNHDDYWKPSDLPPNVEMLNQSLVRRHRLWFSHCPMHPDEIRKCAGNVHGHTHQHILSDLRYLNICIEQLPGFAPISLDEIRAEYARRGIELLHKPEEEDVKN